MSVCVPACVRACVCAREEGFGRISVGSVRVTEEARSTHVLKAWQGFSKLEQCPHLDVR
jgi:hypothetical protein